jgi:tRNA(adenine34) deaminase
VVISRDGTIVAESINRVRHEHDVTRHAEVVAISAAQKALGTVSLDDCTIYVSAESCAYCCYAIRESRIGRVVYGLRSPHMGGVSKWPILPDEDLSNTMPEVFAAPPEIIAGFMAAEAEEALLKYNPVSGGVMKLRGLFVVGEVEKIGSLDARRRSLKGRALAFLRRAVFDRFGRS